MKAREKELSDKTRDLENKFNEIRNGSSPICNPKKPDGTHLINVRSVGEGMVEHIEIMNAIIVPGWAFDAEFLNEKRETAKIQFGNYYADKNESLPKNMWQTPVKLVCDYRSYDYTIGSLSGKLDNYSGYFISYDEALEEFQAYQEGIIKLNKMITEAENKRKKS